MHWKRWLTAAVIIPPLILLILKGGPVWFAGTLMAISALALWEYLRIVCHGHTPAVPVFFYIWAHICGALVVWAVYRQSLVLLMALLALSVIGGGFFSIVRFKNDGAAPFMMVKQLFGLIYIPLSLSFLLFIHASVQGPLWVIFLLWVIAWGDTGALYAGTFFGRHKLCPAVSPKKTIEGALGGLAANLVFGWVFKLLFFSGLSGWTCTLFALCIGLVGQIGDLFESQFKRASGVKDSGALLPGHGGILDRIDALLFAAPVAYLVKEILLP
jgi:phosphatidate cytidylyltransferase